MSLVGTFETCRDVRPESVMCSKADVRQRLWFYGLLFTRHSNALGTRGLKTIKTTPEDGNRGVGRPWLPNRWAKSSARRSGPRLESPAIPGLRAIIFRLALAKGAKSDCKARLCLWAAGRSEIAGPPPKRMGGAARVRKTGFRSGIDYLGTDHPLEPGWLAWGCQGEPKGTERPDRPGPVPGVIV